MKRIPRICLCAVLLSGCAAQQSSENEIPPPVTETTGTTASTVTTVTTVTTAAPPPTAADLLHAYVQDVLIPQYGVPVRSESAENTAHAGIAAAYCADLSGEGEDEMLVIRLDHLDVNCAAVPVFQWYGMMRGEVTLLDEFECKRQWSQYTVRLEHQTLYVSGMLAEDGSPVYTEIVIGMDAHDMTLTDMQVSEGIPPERAYTADALLLLEMQSDTAREGQYVLRSYTMD